VDLEFEQWWEARTSLLFQMGVGDGGGYGVEIGIDVRKSNSIIARIYQFFYLPLLCNK
jgi:hypothetical protein